LDLHEEQPRTEGGDPALRAGSKRPARRHAGLFLGGTAGGAGDPPSPSRAARAGDLMRAWQTTKAGRPRDVLVLDPAAPSPTPREGTVRLAVRCAGLGLPDALMCLDHYALTPPRPFTQGQEVCGSVLDWGSDVRGRRAGERVMAVTSFFTGHGSLAEEC